MSLVPVDLQYVVVFDCTYVFGDVNKLQYTELSWAERNKLNLSQLNWTFKHLCLFYFSLIIEPISQRTVNVCLFTGITFFILFYLCPNKHLPNKVQTVLDVVYSYNSNNQNGILVHFWWRFFNVQTTHPNHDNTGTKSKFYHFGLDLVVCTLKHLVIMCNFKGRNFEIIHMLLK